MDTEPHDVVPEDRARRSHQRLSHDSATMLVPRCTLSEQACRHSPECSTDRVAHRFETLRELQQGGFARAAAATGFLDKTPQTTTIERSTSPQTSGGMAVCCSTSRKKVIRAFAHYPGERSISQFEREYSFQVHVVTASKIENGGRARAPCEKSGGSVWDMGWSCGRGEGFGILCLLFGGLASNASRLSFYR